MVGDVCRVKEGKLDYKVGLVNFFFNVFVAVVVFTNYGIELV